MNDTTLYIRPVTLPERSYTYSQSQQISMQTGFIGYLRADMDSNGEGFFSSWNDFRKDLKTQAFKDEFDEVINGFRDEGYFLPPGGNRRYTGRCDRSFRPTKM